MNYLINKFKGIYRLKCPYDLRTNQYSRKLNGTLEDIDVYIDCYYGNKIFHFGRTTLQAYIPSIIRGHNIIKEICSFNKEIIFEIEETDSEVLFKFNHKNADKVIPLLKPKTFGANISPFSTKNLPKNKSYKIPNDEFALYKKIVAKIPSERILLLTHSTNLFMRSLITKKNTWENIKADMSMRGLKGKEYIHCIGKWDEYIKYLSNNIKEIQ